MMELGPTEKLWQEINELGLKGWKLEEVRQQCNENAHVYRYSKTYTITPLGGLILYGISKLYHIWNNPPRGYPV